MDLTTYAAYRIFDPNKASAQQDYIDRVNAAITSVSAKFASLMGRQVQVGTRTETFSFSKGVLLRSVHLTGYPVSSVTSVIVDEVTLASSDYRLKSESGKITFTPALCRDEVSEGYESDCIQVAYTGGMAVDTATFMSVYPDIVAEVNAQVRFELSRITNIAEVSQSTDGNKTELAPYDLIPSAKRIIEKYRAKRGVY